MANINEEEAIANMLCQLGIEKSPNKFYNVGQEEINEAW